MNTFEAMLDRIGSIVWGPALLVLLVGTGVLLTIRLGGIQFRMLGYALRLAFTRDENTGHDQGDISHFQALMTALAATIGTGNIVGVATAITLGGPGALFWMWVTALFGMATKYAEAILAVKYRTVDENGEMAGGPMYYLTLGAKLPWLGTLFAIFGALATFGIGSMTQANSVTSALGASFGIPPLWSAVVLAVATASVVLGGIKSIGRVTEIMVPIMAIGYGLGALAVLVINIGQLPNVLLQVLSGAFVPAAPIGAFVGASVRAAIQRGVSRGVFSNESGLGSAPIAAAAAKTDLPARQALVSMTGTFIDTIVVCSLTGFCILSSGLWYSGLQGADLTRAAFNAALPGIGGGVVSFGLIFFAYSTILGWTYYGEKCVEYLLGTRAVMPYRWAVVAATFIGALAKLGVVWSFSDIANGLMAIPNLVGLILLNGVVVAETKSFMRIVADESKKKKQRAKTHSERRKAS